MSRMLIFGGGITTATLLFASALLGADGQLPKEKLQELKAATVFIEVGDDANKVSGSGFVLGRVKNTLYLVTNSHVISEEQRVASPVWTVFNSGDAKREKSLKAKVVSNDPVRDLAILAVEYEDGPNPIPSSNPVEAQETSPVYILGFPFGELLAGGQHKPEITVSKGTISSLRKDDTSHVTAIQIDGNINPGNSGGPVVSADGDLLGIAVAKIRGTQIGFAIPAGHLREILLGSIQDVSLRQVRITDGTVTFRALVQLIDPLKRVSKVSIFIVPFTAEPPVQKPNTEGMWERMSGELTRFDLQVDSPDASGEVSVPDSKPEKLQFRFQVAYLQGDGRPRFSAPGVYPSERKETTSVASSAKRSSDSPPASSAPLRPIRPNPKLVPGGSGSTATHHILEPGYRLTGPDTRAKESGESPIKIPFPKPRSQVVEVEISAIKLPREDVKAFELNLATKLKDDRGRDYHAAVWSTAGDNLYLVDANDVLHRFNVSDIKPVAQLEIGAKCLDMAYSKAGLILAIGSGEAVWVVDPKTLKVEREIRIEGVRRVAASPVSDVGYAFGKKGLSVLNLTKGKATYTISSQQVRNFSNSVSNMKASPDGKFLYLADRHIMQLKIKGEDLIFATATEDLGGGASSGMNLSPDGNWLALPSGGGNPNAGGYGIGVFHCDDLSKYAVTLSTGAYPGAFDAQAKTGRFFASDTKKFEVFSPRGGKQFDLSLGSGDLSLILASPAGNLCFCFTSAKFVLVDLSELK